MRFKFEADQSPWNQTHNMVQERRVLAVFRDLRNAPKKLVSSDDDELDDAMKILELLDGG